ncbi:MAG TPA: ATP synthase F1 subunit gamma [Gemmatimonadales bacterium]|jgi:F-type H+-transporting ATPase subunit gamma|nr:ATP synthase F1 subunit gamma [Gemmatimonadales bacterium]
MAKTKALRGRIRSVQNTRKITRTMELVSTSKLKRAQDRVVAARPYAEALREVIADLVTPELASEFPLLRKPAVPARGGPARAAVILVTSNRGLAGGFNSNLIKEARRTVAELEQQGYTVDLYGIGRKGIGYFRYLGRTLAAERIDVGDKPTPAQAVDIMAPLMEQYEQGVLASVDLVYAKFQSAISTPPTTQRILPVEAPEGKGARADYLLEPDAATLLEKLLPLYVRNALYRGLVETAAGEHGARRTAMKNATDNAGEILDGLKRTYNRLRQAAITQEIAEIVGGAAALQG